MFDRLEIMAANLVVSLTTSWTSLESQEQIASSTTLPCRDCTKMSLFALMLGYIISAGDRMGLEAEAASP